MALLDFNCRKILAVALIQPHLDYCISSWYVGLSKQLKDRLDVIQRRMVRFIFSKGPMEHVDTRELKALSWLKVSDREKYFSIVHVFRVRSGLAPDYLSVNFRLLSSIHRHATRGCTYNYFVSKDISNAPNSFCNSAIQYWNSLPIELKAIQSLPVFKAKLRLLLMSNY